VIVSGVGIIVIGLLAQPIVTYTLQAAALVK
jgi:hypothetical protein